MTYFNELSFASGYYFISVNGRITIHDDMPEEMRIKFWETWKKLRPVIIEREKKGLYSSRYPSIPIEDEDPNKWQYE